MERNEKIKRYDSLVTHFAAKVLYFSQHFVGKFLSIKCMLFDVYGHLLSFAGHELFLEI